MLAAPAAIPPKPKIPATIARIINVIVQRNIILDFKLINRTFISQICLLIKVLQILQNTLTQNVNLLSQLTINQIFDVLL